MTPEESSSPPRQPLWFLLLLALAAAGGAVAYVPFLTVLLPVKIAQLTGSDDVASLAYATFAGAIIASFANIGFGWLSDRYGGRWPWIAGGLVISCTLLIGIGQAQSVNVLIALIMAWQLGLNMMLGPLAAWAGDCVPDEQKGLLGGLFAFAPALGALAGAIITIPGLADGATRLVIVAALVVFMVSPILLIGRGHELPQLMQPRGPMDEAEPAPWRSQSAVVRMWIARLLVQIAEAALFAFLLFWLRSLSPGYGENNAARIFSMVLAIAVPLALLAGRWSDKQDRPILPLALAASLSCAGLIIMALAATITAAIAGYLVFGIASILFLSLHSSQTLRVLPKPQNRGRDLGLFNLTNTVPSLIIPWLTLSLVPLFGFSGLFWLLAALCAAASALLFAISRRI
jgi:MFS family permease